MMWYHHYHPTQTMTAHEAVPGMEGMGILRRATPKWSLGFIVGNESSVCTFPDDLGLLRRSLRTVGVDSGQHPGNQ